MSAQKIHTPRPTTQPNIHIHLPPPFPRSPCSCTVCPASLGGGCVAPGALRTRTEHRTPLGQAPDSSAPVENTCVSNIILFEYNQCVTYTNNTGFIALPTHTVSSSSNHDNTHYRVGSPHFVICLPARSRVPPSLPNPNHSPNPNPNPTCTKSSSSIVAWDHSLRIGRKSQSLSIVRSQAVIRSREVRSFVNASGTPTRRRGW